MTNPRFVKQAADIATEFAFGDDACELRDKIAQALEQAHTAGYREAVIATDPALSAKSPDARDEAVCVGYMKSVEGKDEYGMFVNENFRYGPGGFEWKFLDFEPEDKENYRKIYIYKQPRDPEPTIQWPTEERDQWMFQMRRLLNKVNFVTAPHRHGLPLPKERLDDLANRQAEIEEWFEKQRVAGRVE